MANISTRGSCMLCGRPFSKQGMSRHLQSCREENRGGDGGSPRRPGRRRQGFHLAVEGRFRPQYWLHLEIAGNAPLYALDHYLRNTWLECCGHLSAFVIRGRNHFLEDRDIWADLDDRDMEVSLSEVLRQGTRFVHEYDFGSITELALRVVSQGNISVDHRGIRLLARNDPPTIPCVKCSSLATKICTECIWDGQGFYCDECAVHHTVRSPSCDEMFLPVVNSPRMGECTYTGSDDDLWAEQPAPLDSVPD